MTTPSRTLPVSKDVLARLKAHEVVTPVALEEAARELAEHGTDAERLTFVDCVGRSFVARILSEGPFAGAKSYIDAMGAIRTRWPVVLSRGESPRGQFHIVSGEALSFGSVEGYTLLGKALHASTASREWAMFQRALAYGWPPARELIVSHLSSFAEPGDASDVVTQHRISSLLANIKQKEIRPLRLYSPISAMEETDATGSDEDLTATDGDNARFLTRAAELPDAELVEAPVGDVVPAAETAALLGGPDVLGVSIDDIGDLARAVHAGLPAAVLDQLRGAGLQVPEIESLVAPARTLARRRADGRLTVEESAAVERVARMIVLAERVLGSRAAGLNWLRKPMRTRLGGSTPLDFLHSDIGTRVVEEILAQAEYGFVA